MIRAKDVSFSTVLGPRNMSYTSLSYHYYVYQNRKGGRDGVRPQSPSSFGSPRLMFFIL